MASSGKNWSSTINNTDVPLTDISISKNSESHKDDENRNLSPSEIDNGGKNAADRLIVPSYDPVSNMALDPSVPEGFNAYRNKKTLTQGLMDIALFSANANQLRYILEHGSQSQAYFYIAATLIIISLVLQIGVGMLLLLGSQYNVNVQCQREKAYKYGNYVVTGIFLITVVNIFLAAFGGPSYISSPNTSIIAPLREANETSTEIGVGAILLMSTRYSVSIQCQRELAYKYGNYVVIGIFLITIVNIFIAAFGGPAINPNSSVI